jgi:hypothetical protein
MRLEKIVAPIQETPPPAPEAPPPPSRKPSGGGQVISLKNLKK